MVFSWENWKGQVPAENFVNKTKGVQEADTTGKTKQNKAKQGYTEKHKETQSYTEQLKETKETNKIELTPWSTTTVGSIGHWL